jgi:hypothetical protein
MPLWLVRLRVRQPPPRQNRHRDDEEGEKHEDVARPAVTEVQPTHAPLRSSVSPKRSARGPAAAARSHALTRTEDQGERRAASSEWFERADRRPSQANGWKLASTLKALAESRTLLAPASANRQRQRCCREHFRCAGTVRWCPALTPQSTPDTCRPARRSRARVLSSR